MAPTQSVGWSTLLGLGVTVAATIGVGLALGLIIDATAGTAPVFLLVGLLIGIVGAVSYTVVRFRQLLATTDD